MYGWRNACANSGPTIRIGLLDCTIAMLDVAQWHIIAAQTTGEMTIEML